jgi:hypothetical protein
MHRFDRMGDLGRRGDRAERIGRAGPGGDWEVGSSREHGAEGRFEHHPRGATGRWRRAADRQLSEQRDPAFDPHPQHQLGPVGAERAQLIGKGGRATDLLAGGGIAAIVIPVINGVAISTWATIMPARPRRRGAMTAEFAISSVRADAIGPAPHHPPVDQAAAMPPPASRSVAAVATLLAAVAISVLTALLWWRRFFH